MIAIAGGTLALLNLSAVIDGLGAGLSALQALALEQRGGGLAKASAVATYLLGGGFLITALLVWSWAERRT